MRFFFRSRQFKIILAVFLSIAVVSAVCAVIGGNISPQADLAGTILAPFRAGAAKISQSISDFAAAFSQGEEAMLKNAELESEINDLREQLAGYEQAISENEFYKDYLEIKEDNPDFKFSPATIIARDSNDPFKSFTVNRGSTDGISEHDPVITDAGLVGYVSQVGLTTCKITTILDPDITLGALDNRTNDSGVLNGALDTAKDGFTGIYNLSRSCNVTVGDYIVTSGEGIFPEGLLIGSVRTIASEEYNTSIYAVVEPFVDLDTIRDVMIITDFEGQGGLVPGE